MATEVIMPRVDIVMESATFVKWIAREGDRVEKCQPLFIVLTDKAAMEIEAQANGILASVSAQADQVILVSETIAHTLEPGEGSPGVVKPRRIPNLGELVVPITTAENLISAQGFTKQFSAVDEVTSTQGKVMEGRVRITSLARQMTAELGIDLASSQGREPKGRVQWADVQEAVEKRVNPAVAVSVPSPKMKGAGFLVSLPEARRKEVVSPGRPVQDHRPAHGLQRLGCTTHQSLRER